MKQLKLTLATISLVAIFGCNSEQQKPAEPAKDFTELHKKARATFAVLPDSANNPENLITPEKVELGKMLYFDTRLSMKGTQSCNTCHNLDTYGVDNKPTSDGDNGAKGNRNSPTSVNSAFQFVQFWDGRAKDLEEQAGGPVLNPVEMGMPNEKEVIKRLKAVPAYVEMFKKAFPGEKDPMTYLNVTKAIAAFERTLITKSKFDEYIAGNDSALTVAELEGLNTYLEVGCATCHSGAALGGSMYQKFALFGDYWTQTGSTTIDSGRYVVTKNQADIFMFKVPILRNIEKTHPYFHDGSVADLDKAIAIMGKTELNKDLTAEQIASIKLFLQTLTADLAPEVKKAPVLP